MVREVSVIHKNNLFFAKIVLIGFHQNSQIRDFCGIVHPPVVVVRRENARKTSGLHPSTKVFTSPSFNFGSATMSSVIGVVPIWTVTIVTVGAFSLEVRFWIFLAKTLKSVQKGANP